MLRVNYWSLTGAIFIILFSGLVGYLGSIPAVYFLTLMTALFLLLSLHSVITLKIRGSELNPRTTLHPRFSKIETAIHLKIERILPFLGFEPNLKVNIISPWVQYKIKGEGEMKILLNIQPTQIGHWKVLEIILTISSPLNLFYKEIHLREPIDWKITPRYLRLSKVVEVIAYHRRGEIMRKGRKGDYLLGVREYREGDDIRDISWKHTARLGKYMVSVWTKPSEEILIIPIISQEDLEPEGNDRPIDNISEVTFSIAHRLYQEDLPFKVLIGNELISDIDILKEKLLLLSELPHQSPPIMKGWKIIVTSPGKEIPIRGEGVVVYVSSSKKERDLPEIEVRPLGREA